MQKERLKKRRFLQSKCLNKIEKNNIRGFYKFTYIKKYLKVTIHSIYSSKNFFRVKITVIL